LREAGRLARYLTNLAAPGSQRDDAPSGSSDVRISHLLGPTRVSATPSWGRSGHALRVGLADGSGECDDGAFPDP
jgi:hypothetical protein